jgi:hypothetical protein
MPSLHSLKVTTVAVAALSSSFTLVAASPAVVTAGAGCFAVLSCRRCRCQCPFCLPHPRRPHNRIHVHTVAVAG